MKNINIGVNSNNFAEDVKPRRIQSVYRLCRQYVINYMFYFKLPFITENMVVDLDNDVS